MKAIRVAIAAFHDARAEERIDRLVVSLLDDPNVVSVARVDHDEWIAYVADDELTAELAVRHRFIDIIHAASPHNLGVGTLRVRSVSHRDEAAS